MALRFANFEPSLTVVRIDPPDRIDVDLNSVEFVVIFGGAKDDVGTTIVAKAKGSQRCTHYSTTSPFPPLQSTQRLRCCRCSPAIRFRTSPRREMHLAASALTTAPSGPKRLAAQIAAPLRSRPRQQRDTRRP